MQLKSSPRESAARIAGISPEMVLGALIIYDVLKTHKKEFTISSGTEGPHGRASLHFVGNALDIRTHNWMTGEATPIVADLKASLGIDFDVVLESNHLHVEFQPKESL